MIYEFKQEANILDFGVVINTVPSIEDAKSISSTLVKEKVAACVNIIPKVTSVYEWEDKINIDEEFILLIKIRKSNFEKAKQTILNLHSYELPEIIFIPIEQAHNDYLDWINSVTKNFS